ncbi:MAG: ABC transporter substrate-binding protein [Oscillospiraceae bacterium]|jgi:ABC-type nitrate/sulfonate/bicarbonate transport system substrate-binding protein|nr:ABC transporter substrate-binding protein [Oscillospiraceae bacterium]
MKPNKNTLARLFAVVTIIALTVALFAACSNNSGTAATNAPTSAPAGGDSTQAPATNAELITIHSSSRLECTSTPFVLAEKLGFFAEEGLKIEYTGEIPAGSNDLSTVLNGTNDVLTTHPNTFATWVNEGAAVKTVALDIVDPPKDADPALRHMRLYATNAQINSLADLANYKQGQKIKVNGTVPSCSSFILNSIFENAGISSDRLEWVLADSTAAALQALEQGDLDVVFIHPPFYYIAEQNGYKLIADSFDAGLGAAAGTYFIVFSEDYIAKYPDNVQHFINAFKKAHVYANEHPEEAAALTQEHIQQEVRATHYYYTDDGIPRSYVQPWIDDLVSAGALDEGSITVDDLVTFQFEKELP